MARSPAGTTTQRVSSRNATFQQWQALLTNRTKRHRAGALLVSGVRPLTVAVESGHVVREWLHGETGSLSAWARDLVAHAPAQRFVVADELRHELGGKEQGTPELLAVVEMADGDIRRLDAAADFLGVLLDRPSSPGNVGTIIRSVDALGGHAVVVTGHATDPYDPQAVRASTGSVFGVPIVSAAAPREVLEWVDGVRRAGVPLRLVATDERAERDVWDHDLTGPVLLLTGNETTGLSQAWRDAADDVVRIPMAGSASSLNAASATTAILYEAARQRLRGRG
ncbi:tRNA/rRNA methyltransferase (SpoU) [Beutenbergia cavernae DSM 12333]|uniref:tRNA/rRNA methyltransferase (SpoU) n=1 Tax=Beutenbergia cavernae (strain ATCC BAA-8 / DSM 12333 / CCUG 43141 / JCM 11478 / NBRC 16432 / NCIMB 13614 / HKI 0122) TaxID=471853 RepID=C5BVX9_BEUC1|nr:TrmH family RNA methyltransferase [Beutenbergia cavernae]ACQ80580.1 tRNA/rRNA methyltransferase (SpoU) [Beutenbergia cavernae DSM 12333]